MEGKGLYIPIMAGVLGSVLAMGKDFSLTVVACERCFVPTLAYYRHYWLYAKLGDTHSPSVMVRV